jgi:hypothetical protein
LLATGAKAGPNPENRLVRDGRLYPFGNPLRRHMTKAAIFDVDGTLVDSVDLYQSA